MYKFPSGHSWFPIRVYFENLKVFYQQNHCFYTGSIEDLEKISNADVIFASPEVLLGDSESKAYIRDLSVALIVIDEFHTIASWWVN